LALRAGPWDLLGGLDGLTGGLRSFAKGTADPCGLVLTNVELVPLCIEQPTQNWNGQGEFGWGGTSVKR